MSFSFIQWIAANSTVLATAGYGMFGGMLCGNSVAVVNRNRILPGIHIPTRNIGPRKSHTSTAVFLSIT